MTLKDKVKAIFNKDNISSEIKNRKKLFNINTFLKQLFIVFLVFSVIFIYFYYFRGADGGNYQEAVNQNISIDDGLKSDSIANEEKETTKDDVIESIRRQLSNINSKELSKLNDYLDLKSNRGSLEVSIKKYKKNKEDLYVYLIQNEKLFKSDRFNYKNLETEIIRSVLFSSEILDAFSSKSIKLKIKELIDVYY